jgi:WD40 repeat protein
LRSICVINTKIFTVGGTVQASEGLYLPRKADKELLKLCRLGRFAYVLSSRQVGKSSLMVATARQLEEDGIQTAIIDLNAIGTSSPEAWYLGILCELANELSLHTDIASWWKDHSYLSITQRFTNFFQEVLLREIDKPVVIFIDEIDTTLSMDFTDYFFMAIRALHNSRHNLPDVQRFSFVLIGVATPTDLIRDPNHTPFNIGEQVDLSDFTLEEVMPLADGLQILDRQKVQVMRWILKWTGGHPYLTQRLCSELAKNRSSENNILEQATLSEAVKFSNLLEVLKNSSRIFSNEIFNALRNQKNSSEEIFESDIAQVVSNIFFGAMSTKDSNLCSIRGMLTHNKAPSGVLETYSEVLNVRKVIYDEEQHLAKNYLKLIGIVRKEVSSSSFYQRLIRASRSDKPVLKVRNAIYLKVFNKKWTEEHIPESLWQRLKPALPILALVLVTITGSVGATMFYLGGFSALSAAGAKRLKEGELAGKSIEAIRNLSVEAPATSLERLTGLAKALQLVQESKEDFGGITFPVKFALLQGLQKATIRNSFIDNKSSREKPPCKMEAANGEPYSSNAILSVTFSKDSEKIVSGSCSGKIQLWDLQGNLLETASRHENLVNSVAFSPDGEKIVSGGWDTNLFLWNSEGKPLEGSFVGSRDVIRSVAFSPDGTKIVSGGGNGETGDFSLHLWDIHGNPIGQPFKGHTEAIFSVTFSPDGTRIVSASADTTIKLWDLKGNLLYTGKESTSSILSIAYSSDGNKIASSNSDGIVDLWKSNPEKNKLDHEGRIHQKYKTPISSVAFSPIGNVIATGSDDGVICFWIWDQTDKPIQYIYLQKEIEVVSIAFSHDGKTLASADSEGNINLWDLNTPFGVQDRETSSLYEKSLSEEFEITPIEKMESFLNIACNRLKNSSIIEQSSKRGEDNKNLWQDIKDICP